MIGDQAFEVQPFNLPINHSPLATDHHPIRPIRAAQQQRRHRIMAAGEAQLIQFEQRQIRLFADCKLAEPLGAQPNTSSGVIFSAP